LKKEVATMKNISIDVAVLGAGTAGLAAYRAAKAAGKSAVIIESGVYGTTCARVGCMPSKLLIAAAEAAHSVDRFEAFGLRLDNPVKVDSAAVMARVKRERDRFVGFVVEGVEKIPLSDRLIGRAEFTSSHTLLIKSANLQPTHSIFFKTAVIATGSSPQVFPMLREAGDRLIINDDVFDWDVLPDSVAVFGPGVIGLELGQALHRLGVKVHLFGRGGIGAGLSDPVVKNYAEQTFKQEFSIDFDAQVSHVARTESGVAIHWKDSGGRIRSETFDYVLAATGRTPNVQGIGIDKIGLVLDQKGVPVFDRETLQCGTSGIFIAGDANADVPLLHEAADEGKIAGTNAASYPKVNKGLRRTPIAVVFSDPQIAVIGQRFAEIDPHVRVVGEVSFEDQGRSRVMLRNKGILRVYAHALTGRFIGAEMMGPTAEHLAHLLAWAHQSGMTIPTMLEMPFYHPVIEEGLRTALRDVAAKLTVHSALEQVAA